MLRSLEVLKGPDTVAEAVRELAQEKNDSETILEMLELFGRDLMLLQNGGEIAEVSDAERLSRMKLKGSKLLEGVLEMRAHLAGNVQWVSALEYLYFELAINANGGKLKWQP